MEDQSAGEFDRVLLVSFQPDKARAAQQLATLLLGALRKLNQREGVLVAQLDELVLGSGQVVADIPFLPSEPVALCLTGTPRLVAAVKVAVVSGTKTRFVEKRPQMGIQSLRVSVVVRDATIAIDTNREFSSDKARDLGVAGWAVAETRGEEPSPALFVGDEMLSGWAKGVPTPFVPAAKAEEGPGVSPRRPPGEIVRERREILERAKRAKARQEEEEAAQEWRDLQPRTNPKHYAGVFVEGGNLAQSLVPALKMWTVLVGAYRDRQADDLPFWFNEEATVGMLGAAAWMSGGIAVQEYQHIKGMHHLPGYADLWMRIGQERISIEAKQAWPRNLESLVSKATKALEAARSDVRAINLEEANQRYGCVFLVPKIAKAEAPSFDPAAWLDELNVLWKSRVDFRAYWFQSSRVGYDWARNEQGYSFPGVVLLGSRVGRRRAR